MANPFDTPPSGYARGKKGWIVPAQTPQMAVAKRLKEENKALKGSLAELEVKVNALIDSGNKKKK
jgi:hypothetical protein